MEPSSVLSCNANTAKESRSNNANVINSIQTYQTLSGPAQTERQTKSKLNNRTKNPPLTQ